MKKLLLMLSLFGTLISVPISRTTMIFFANRAPYKNSSSYNSVYIAGTHFNTISAFNETNDNEKSADTNELKKEKHSQKSSIAKIENIKEAQVTSAQIFDQIRHSYQPGKRVARFGRWKSNLKAKDVFRSQLSSILEVDIKTGSVLWSQQDENGRSSIFQFNPDSGKVVRRTPLKHNVKSMVNGYGGRSFSILGDLLIYSIESGELYIQRSPEMEPTSMNTHPARKFADWCVNEKHSMIFAIMDDYDQLHDGSPTQTLVALDPSTGTDISLFHHADFYASPRVSPDGSKLIWIEWNYPNMPWDQSRLVVASLEDETALDLIKYLQHGSIMMPKFKSNNEIFYVHDSSGWWNLYMNDLRHFETNLTPFPAEVGGPMWRLGDNAYDINPKIGSNEVVAVSGKELLLINTLSKTSRVINTTYDSIFSPVYSPDGKKIYILGANATHEMAVVELDITLNETSIIFGGKTPSFFGNESISIPTDITFETTEGDVAYGKLYMPSNVNYTASEGSLPPLIVNNHGGPTTCGEQHLNLEFQFFTTRGFAILDVNYRGSSGYGSEYRNKLRWRWGELDVDDVISGTQTLVERKIVDPKLIFVRGKSSGGFTTLGAMAKSSIFCGGTSYYGVTDLVSLPFHTHKFERGYLETLIGPLNENVEKYMKLSPISNAVNFSSPVLFLHGKDDMVVPAAQSIEMQHKLSENGVETRLLLFIDEQHGFLRNSSRMLALQAEAEFYLSKILMN